MSIEEEIILFIRRNRVSTTELADAMGKKGLMPGVKPIIDDVHRVGRVRCVFAAFESNYEVHEQIRDIQEGEVVVVFVHECNDRAILGDLVARFIMFYRGAEALVVNGALRDLARLKREKYPIWSEGVTPIGCFNTPAEPFPEEQRKSIEKKYSGGIAVCDDGGVVVIPPDQVNTEMLEKLYRIELQEDVWAYCLNTLKWDTKRIVCDKEYLQKSDMLPDSYNLQLAELLKKLDAK